MTLLVFWLITLSVSHFGYFSDASMLSIWFRRQIGIFFFIILLTDLRNTYMIIFGLAALLAQCNVKMPITSLSHVCDWTVSGARAPYMCVPARVCTSLREPRYRYTKAELLSLTKPYVCSSECSAVSLISTFSALIRRYQRHKT